MVSVTHLTWFTPTSFIAKKEREKANKPITKKKKEKINGLESFPHRGLCEVEKE